MTLNQEYELVNAAMSTSHKMSTTKYNSESLFYIIATIINGQ